MAGNDLTAVLADRLAAIVPAGFYVDATDGMLWYSADEGRFPSQLGNYQVGRAGTHIQAVYGDADEENIADIAAQALDHLQDYVSEATHDPWPGTTAQSRPVLQDGSVRADAAMSDVQLFSRMVRYGRGSMRATPGGGAELAKLDGDSG
jgi:hypothetical protein